MNATAKNLLPSHRNTFDDSVETAARNAGFSEEAIERFRNRKKAPKKYADTDRTEVTTEYRIWKQAHRWDADEASQGQLLSHGDGPANHAVYYPEQYDKDLGEGAWIFVIDPPITEQWSRFKVPLLSLWWARPHVLNDGQFGTRLPYQAIIQTPAGDLHLWPHEYTLCVDPQEILGEEGMEIHTLGGEPLLDEDHLFYLQQRGITRTEAVKMLFAQINQPNYCYVTLPPDAVNMFVGVGARSGSSIVGDYREGRVR